MSDFLEIDELLRLFYAAASAVSDDKCAEVEFERESEDGEVLRIAVRKEVKPFNYNTSFHGSQEDHEH